MRKSWFVVVMGLVIAFAIGVAVVSWIGRGFSARDQPSWVERFVARGVRSLSVPGRMKDAPNPVAFTPEVLADARAHYADHCASCHANDGSGGTEIGQHLYPKAPDMRLADTQNLTDGELFYIIHYGIRLSGMPAWGSDDEQADQDSWKLVYFIRHLPAMTSEETSEMEALNPKSPAEREEEKADQDFLNGAPDAPSHAGHEGMKMPDAAGAPHH